MVTWRDPNTSPELRAKSLLAEMNLKEKLAQLRSVWACALLEDGKFSLAKAGELLSAGIGAVSRPTGSTGLPAEEAAELVNAIQRYLLRETRLGIPALVHEECLAGVLAPEAVLFPQPLALASTWDVQLAEEMACFIRDQLLGLGVRQALAPVLDITRDPRWGRIEETFGEDPFLAGSMGVAYVKGLQTQDIKHGVLATLKHFAGHGASEGGQNCAPAHIAERELREIFLAPFERAICEGGALAVMAAYHEIDGVPCTASSFLLQNILRDSWRFPGIVVSDYFAIEMLQSLHRLARDFGHAASLALIAGVDLELPHSGCFGSPLQALVEDGAISEEVIDRAVFRILRTKFLLGLFESPFVNVKVTQKVFSAEKIKEGRQLAREIARKSIVLLKNDGILPLTKKIKSIAVIGPSAADPRNYLGDYHFPAHVEKAASPAMARVVTVLQAIRERVGNDVRIAYAKGCETTGYSKAGFAEAISAAREADAVIVVVGDRSGLSDNCTVGESRDMANIRLPGAQEDLVREITRTGKPVILVLLIGRPYVLTDVIELVNAALVVWLPGETGGEAIADVLFGEWSPGGKLPVTFPRSTGQIPIYYNRKPSGLSSHPRGHYVDEEAAPLFPFGHGLSYTRFEYTDLIIEPEEVPCDGRVRITFTLKNTGERAGDEVVQLYIQQEHRCVTRPVKELKGFARVSLNPGEAKEISFDLPMDVLAYYGQDMSLVVEPGPVEIMIGSSSSDIRLTGKFIVCGRREIRQCMRRYSVEVSIGPAQREHVE